MDHRALPGLAASPAGSIGPIALYRRRRLGQSPRSRRSIRCTNGPANATKRCASGSSGTRGEISPPTGPSTMASTLPPTRNAASAWPSFMQGHAHQQNGNHQQAGTDQPRLPQREGQRQQAGQQKEDVEVDGHAPPAAQAQTPSLDAASGHDMPRQRNKKIAPWRFFRRLFT